PLDSSGHEPPVTVVRRAVRGGPGAARNTAARLATSELLAFLDSDVSCPPGWLDGLLGHFGDPDVVAVAPRVVSAPAHGLAGLVETQRCALDLGEAPAVVRPGSAVPFVPTAALLVRRAAFEAVGGFDESLPLGEDVELLRRLGEHGGVRYEPRVTVLHAPRRQLRAVLGRRFRYGTSAAVLDELRPGSVRHLDTSIWGVAPLLVAAVHPLAGAGCAAGLVVVAPRSLGRLGLPPSTARSLAWRGQVSAARGVARFAVRPFLPLLCAAVAFRPLRRRALSLAAAGLLVEIMQEGRLPPEPVRRLMATFLDDLAYGSGVLWGCAARRRSGPLRPRLGGLRRTIRPAGQRAARPARAPA
ncbi:MAG TPA: glycosyltransferase, partial [Acidimicrobiales bacterium]|nr:glycosyltransferase [Acidimicrobiales bacterium]